MHPGIDSLSRVSNKVYVLIDGYGSQRLALEANLVVDDEAFGATLSQSLKRTVEMDGHQILSAGWKQQSAGLRFLSWLCYGLLRLMQGISGYAGENSWGKNG